MPDPTGTSCHVCKYHKGITAPNGRQTGCKCAIYGKPIQGGDWLAPIDNPCYVTFYHHPTGQCSRYIPKRQKQPSKIDVAANSGITCFFCGKSIELSVTHRDVVIHHVKPLHAGGTHAFDNCRLAHRVCHDKYHRNQG